MPPPRSWVSPPTRREMTLLAFSLMIFVLAYNLETSLRMVGVSPSKLSTSYLGKVGILAQDPGYDRDGRRPQAWRDDLETLIAGDWDWDEGQIAGVERGPIGVSGSHGAFPQPIYNVGKAKPASRSAAREDPGIGVTEGVTVNEQIVRWETTIPETKTVAHVPGYTILENVFMLNGTCFLVADTPSSLPPLNFIASSSSSGDAPTGRDWRVLNRVTAQNLLGTFGGRIRGTTWLATDAASAQDPYTLFALLRAHSHLATPHPTSAVSPSGLHIIYPERLNMGLGGLVGVPPPARLWFPHIPTFSSPQLAPEGTDIKAHPPLRTKSYMGAHPLLPKAILPTMGLLYTETWKDYADLHLPFLLDRVLVADRAAAARGRAAWAERWDAPGEDVLGDELRRRDAAGDGGVDGLPAWAAPFVGLDAPREWWAPARAALRSYLGLPLPAADARRGKPVLTYVSMADEPHSASADDGGRVRDEDHAALVEGLAGLLREGVLGGVHVVRGNGTRGNWEERMRAIAQSSIVIGAWGRALADSVFMSPPPNAHSPSTSPSTPPAAPILMEFFPTGTFVRDQEYAARAAGLRYAAWWDDRKFAPADLPPVMGVRAGQNPYLSVAVPAVLHAIRAEAQALHA